MKFESQLARDTMNARKPTAGSHSSVKILAVVFLCLLNGSAALAEQTAPLRQSYSRPAETGKDALSLKNGKMSALIFGGVMEERIQFSDKPLAAANCLGELRLQFQNHQTATDYQRELDLVTDVARIDYRVDEVSFRREALLSIADQALVVRIIADHRGWVSFKLRLESPLTNSHSRAIAPNILSFTGATANDASRFDARVKIIATGGTVRTNGNSIEVENADSAVVFLTIASGNRNFRDRPAGLARRATRALEKVSHRKFETILADHVADLKRRAAEPGAESRERKTSK